MVTIPFGAFSISQQSEVLARDSDVELPPMLSICLVRILICFSWRWSRLLFQRAPIGGFGVWQSGQRNDWLNNIIGATGSSWYVCRLDWDLGQSTVRNPHQGTLCCNDPHLMLTLPSVVLNNRLLRLIAMWRWTFRRNPRRSHWFNQSLPGELNAGWDVQDWYKIQWSDEEHKHMLDGKQTPVQQRRKILVRGQDPVFDTILMTFRGPVVYTQPSQSRYGLAMHWIIQDSFAMKWSGTPSSVSIALKITRLPKAVRNFSYPAKYCLSQTASDAISHLQFRVKCRLRKINRVDWISDGSDSHNSWFGISANVA